MKVLFINTYDTGGGAAIISVRLSKALQQGYAIEAVHVAGSLRSGSGNAIPARGRAGELIEKIIDRLTNKIGAQYLFFPFSSRAILKIIRETRPDVISLHNTHGGYFQTNLLEKISSYAPVVWTLHDMWSFTGNAAHTFGNTSWKHLENDDVLTSIYPAIGINTGKRLLKWKRKIYQRSNLTIVTPSRWLWDLASQSPVLTGKNITHIFNGLDLQVFRPRMKSSIRATFGIPMDAKVVMFSAEHLKDNFWEGGDELSRLLVNLNGEIQSPIHVLAVGKGELAAIGQLNKLIIHHTGYIESEDHMAECYSAADLFIYPTRADNLPNVLVEAIACGVPCVTFDIGGCKEIIANGENGLIIQGSRDAARVAKLLEDAAALQEMSQKAREIAEEKFSSRAMADAYYKVFESLIRST